MVDKLAELFVGLADCLFGQGGILKLTIVFDATTVVDVDSFEHVLDQSICVLQSCD